MPFAQDNPRDTLIMRLAAGTTTALLFITLFMCWQFNLSHGGAWFARAALFLVLALLLIWRLCLHIREGWLRAAISIVGVELLAAYTAARAVSFYYQGESFNEEYFFHFNRDTIAFGLATFPGQAALIVLYLLLLAAGAYLAVSRLQHQRMANRTFLIWPAAVVVLLLDPDLGRLAEYGMRESNTQAVMELSAIDWEGTGLDREALYKVVDEIGAGKNVVMIYLESVEQMYTDESVYPGLTPYLSSLADEALVFDNIYETRGTNFTVAGILSSQCGTPLLFAAGPGGPGGNDILKNGFMQEAFCLGDILDVAGYRQVFMGGASTRFAGKGVFLADHGYDEVYGLEQLQPLLDDPSYISSWGVYDDSLLELAAQRFDQVAAETQGPFNFSVLTVDTHPPDGTVSKSCAPYPLIDNNIFHAVHCTDQLLEKFIGHLEQSPEWEDTVVFIMSDHLHMRNTGMEYYPPDYERKLLVYMLNAGQTGVVDTPGTHMDIAPTLLSLMGVQHQQAFLAGDNLLDPAAATRPFDPANGARIAAIRYLNMNMLSRIETGLCEADPLYSIERSNIDPDSVVWSQEVEGARINPFVVRVAGKEINLSRRGRTLPVQAVGLTHALMSLVTTEGKVGLTFPVRLELLEYELYTHRENNFLLLAPWESLSNLADMPRYEGLGLLFGNLNDGLEVLLEDLDFSDSFALETDCQDLVDRARDHSTDGIDGLLGNICHNTAPDGFTWDADAGRLELQSITYANQRFRATLNRNSQGWYAVTGLQELDPIMPEGVCSAYYGNQEILIPGLQTGTDPVSMVLKKIPGIPLTFELGSVSPLAQ